MELRHFTGYPASCIDCSSVVTTSIVTFNSALQHTLYTLLVTELVLTTAAAIISTSVSCLLCTLPPSSSLRSFRPCFCSTLGHQRGRFLKIKTPSNPPLVPGTFSKSNETCKCSTGRYRDICCEYLSKCILKWLV